MSSKGEYELKDTLETKVTKKEESGSSWSGEVRRNDKCINVEVNSISGLLALCAKASGQ